MVAIHAISGRTLALGREGENLARQVVFDISEWRASYGDGTVSLIAQRHGDAEPYPCNITVDGDTVTWPITSADTAHPDYGKCELRYSVGDVLVKSEMWRTFVADALGTPQPEPPEPQKAWVDKVLAAGQAAVNASVNSPKIGSNGNWFVWDFEAGKYVDTGVAASGGGSGAVSTVNGKTGDVTLTAGDVGAVSVPAAASVGQTVVVKAVDDSGKPTEWEAADRLPKSPIDWEPWTSEEQAAARERMGVPGAYALVNEITLAEEVGAITLNKTASGENYNFSDVIILMEAPNKDNPTCFINLNGIPWAGGMIRNGAKYHYIKIGVDGGRNRFEYALGNDSSSLVSVNTLLLAMAWYPITKITEIKISKLASEYIPEGVTFKVYAR